MDIVFLIIFGVLIAVYYIYYTIIKVIIDNHSKVSRSKFYKNGIEIHVKKTNDYKETRLFSKNKSTLLLKEIVFLSLPDIGYCRDVVILRTKEYSCSKIVFRLGKGKDVHAYPVNNLYGVSSKIKRKYSGRSVYSLPKYSKFYQIQDNIVFGCDVLCYTGNTSGKSNAYSKKIILDASSADAQFIKDISLIFSLENTLAWNYYHDFTHC